MRVGVRPRFGPISCKLTGKSPPPRGSSSASAHPPGARHCTVNLKKRDTDLEIEVIDDGSGFDPALLEQQAGLGLLSARERLGLFGGNLETWSAPGKGSHMTVRVPLSQVDLKD